EIDRDGNHGRRPGNHIRGAVGLALDRNAADGAAVADGFTFSGHASPPHLKSSKLSPSPPGPSGHNRSGSCLRLRSRKAGIARSSPGASPPFPRISATSATSTTMLDFVEIFPLRSGGLLRLPSATSVALVADPF